MNRIILDKRLRWVIALLLSFAVGGQGASAATLNFTGQVRVSCSVTAIESPAAIPVSATPGAMKIGSISVSSTGKPLLAIRHVSAFDASGAGHDIPVHLIVLRSDKSPRRSRLQNGFPHLRLTDRSERVTVNVTGPALIGLSSGAYRFQIAALCGG